MSDELYIGTGPTTGGGKTSFSVSKKSGDAIIEVRIGDMPTMEESEIRSLLWHIGEMIVKEGLPALRKQARAR